MPSFKKSLIVEQFQGNYLIRKRKPHTMSEKRHKINKFANYQDITVRNSPAFSKPLIFGF